ncbi:hypothetical protein WA171_005335 [Blastocystis sp. BT1]
MAAKAFHARLNGDKKSAVEYERDLEGLRSGKRRRVDQYESKEEDGKVEIVTPLDEHGNLLPALMKQQIKSAPEDRLSGGRRGIKKEERDLSIAEMKRAILTHEEKSIDEMIMHNIIKQGHAYKPLGSSTTGLDEEDEIDVRQYKGKEEFMTDKKRQETEMKEAIKAHQRWENITANCFYCYGSDVIPKDNIIALGDHTYLTMCSKMRLNEWHVQICPLQHIWSQTECDEEVTNEIQRFKQSLTAMAHSLGRGLICFEEVHLPRGRQHCVVECVMVPKEVEMDAPIYFRKAMLECDDVWQAANRKCMDTSEKGLLRSVPKGFAYCYVEWSNITGSPGSLVHMIEDEKNFKRNFAQDVLAGMLDLPTSEMLRRSDEDIQAILKRFLKVWLKFDWTSELDT